jgi:uncharacterized membrane protein
MNKISKTVAVLSAFAITTMIATAMVLPQTAFAQPQTSIATGSTNGGTVGATSAGIPFGTSSAASGGPSSTQCLSAITPAAAVSLCASD